MRRTTHATIAIYTAAIVVALITLLPILWTVLTSFKTEQEILSNPTQLLPRTWIIENYTRTLLDTDYKFFAINSFIVATSSTIIVMILSITSAYAYSKFYSFRGKNPLVALVLIARMVPEIAIVIPLFLVVQSIGLYDNRLGLILVEATLAFPLATWLLKTFFDDIPESIVEAAKIDGCTSFGILRKIILPISGPALASTFTITFLTAWNSFLIPLVFSKTVNSKTLPVAISELAFGEYGVNWGGLSAVAVVTVLPVFLIGLFAQKYLTSGLTAGIEK